jgi:hypothetical protein
MLVRIIDFIKIILLAISIFFNSSKLTYEFFMKIFYYFFIFSINSVILFLSEMHILLKKYLNAC